MRWLIGACAAGILTTMVAADTGKAPVVRGTLVADLRNDVEPGAAEWVNHVVGDASVGNFKRPDGKPMNVVSLDTPEGKVRGVKFNRAVEFTMVSAKPIPAEMKGKSNATVEVWYRALAVDADMTVLAYGARERRRHRQFLYGPRPFTGYYSDINEWGSHIPDLNQFHHLAWVYEAEKKTMSIYVDGKLSTTGEVDLNTDATPIALGAGNGVKDHTLFDREPGFGFIASVRVMSGVLSAEDVQINFLAGVRAGVAEPTDKPSDARKR